MRPRPRHLIGGPPRAGSSTLAQLILERCKIAWCGTDILVNMLAEAAPELGVYHGSHPDKVQSAFQFLVEFLRPFSYTGGDYLLEGDVVTPYVPAEAAGTSWTQQARDGSRKWATALYFHLPAGRGPELDPRGRTMPTSASRRTPHDGRSSLPFEEACYQGGGG